MKIKTILVILIIVGSLISSCSTGSASSDFTVQPTAETDAILSRNSSEVTTSNTPRDTSAPEAGALPPPQVTRTSTASEPEPTEPLPTPLPSATPPHPLTIEYLRQGDFPGSEIVIEEVLEPGLNYNRYIASYMSEGLKIDALLTVPFGEKPPTGWPVIIFNHGYIPPDQYRTTERYVAYVNDIAMHGYIVFRSDYRGHAFSEGEARGAYGYPDYTIDILNAVASMKKYPDADPNRIGMWGHSMGGYITLRSMVVSEDIKAGVIWAGVVASYPDLLTRWRRPSTSSNPTAAARARNWRDALVGQFGTFEENPEFWDSISANTYLEDLSGPVQLHHGTEDQSVPLTFSSALEKEIIQAGGVVEYFEYKGDDHNISTSFGDAMFRTLQFFDKYVKGSTSQ
jgi:dienelactone hydrolase